MNTPWEVHGCLPCIKASTTWVSQGLVITFKWNIIFSSLCSYFYFFFFLQLFSLDLPSCYTLKPYGFLCCRSLYLLVLQDINTCIWGSHKDRAASYRIYKNLLLSLWGWAIINLASYSGESEVMVCLCEIVSMEFLGNMCRVPIMQPPFIEKGAFILNSILILCHIIMLCFSTKAQY